MTVQRGRPSGHCTICRFSERARVELLLAGSASFSAVARKFGLSPDAVRRHWHQHVSEERRVALLAGPVQVQALAAKVAEESESVLDHHRANRAGLYALYTAALEAGDRQTGALISGRLRDVNDSIARLTGQLASSPLITINQTQQTVAVLLERPEVAQFWSQMLESLHDLPNFRDIAARLEAFCTARAHVTPALLPAPEAVHDAA